MAAKKTTGRRSATKRSPAAPPLRRVLFLCSGNYYRSRYAEALFNHHARAAEWPWRAFSRGLSTHLVDDEISRFTRQILLHRGIALKQTAPAPRALTRSDLAQAAHVVALKESEHRPIMSARFPRHADKVEYWKVHDLDAGSPAQAFAAIDQLVARLAVRLLRQEKSPT
jgi:protein-tyrosine phosphatase